MSVAELAVLIPVTPKQNEMKEKCGASSHTKVFKIDVRVCACLQAAVHLTTTTISDLDHPTDRGALQATVHGVTQNWTRVTYIYTVSDDPGPRQQHSPASLRPSAPTWTVHLKIYTAVCSPIRKAERQAKAMPPKTRLSRTQK